MTLKLMRLFADSIFDASDFDEQQLEEINLGMEESGKVSYLNPYIKAEDMRKLRLGKNKFKLNIKLAANPQ